MKLLNKSSNYVLEIEKFEKETKKTMYYVRHEISKLISKNEKKEKKLEDIKSYIKNSDLDKMLWGKELLKIIERND